MREQRLDFNVSAAAETVAAAAEGRCTACRDTGLVRGGEMGDDLVPCWLCTYGANIAAQRRLHGLARGVLPEFLRP